MFNLHSKKLALMNLLSCSFVALSLYIHEQLHPLPKSVVAFKSEIILMIPRKHDMFLSLVGRHDYYYYFFHFLFLLNNSH
jgi:hypothetical protein